MRDYRFAACDVGIQVALGGANKSVVDSHTKRFAMNFGLRVILLLPATFATRVAAQKPMVDTTREPVRASVPAALRDIIASADSSLFAAFNRGQLTNLMSFFTRDLEFYQDNEGVENYQQTRADFAHNVRAARTDSSRACAWQSRGFSD
jgi:hypothetical protein